MGSDCIFLIIVFLFTYHFFFSLVKMAYNKFTICTLRFLKASMLCTLTSLSFINVSSSIARYPRILEESKYHVEKK